MGADWLGSLLAADLTFTLVASCLAAFAAATYSRFPTPSILARSMYVEGAADDVDVCLSLCERLPRLLQLVCTATTLTPFYLHIKQHR